MWDWIIGLNWQTLFAGLALVISILSIVLGLLDRQKIEHDQVLAALQGEKQAVAYISRQLERGRLGGSRTKRLEITAALANAWIFASSDRARAMIYAVLKESCESNEIRREITSTLHDIESKLSAYVEDIYPGEEDRVSKYKNRIAKLQAGLEP